MSPQAPLTKADLEAALARLLPQPSTEPLATKADVAAVATALRDHIDERFDLAQEEHRALQREVNGDIARVVGRVARQDTAIAVLRENQQHLERSVFTRRETDPAPATDDVAPLLTKADGRKAAYVILSIAGTVEFLHRTGGWMWHKLEWLVGLGGAHR